MCPWEDEGDPGNLSESAMYFGTDMVACLRTKRGGSAPHYMLPPPQLTDAVGDTNENGTS